MWPMFLLQSALMYAASTIKNPNSKNALLLKEIMFTLLQQMKITYPEFFAKEQ